MSLFKVFPKSVEEFIYCARNLPAAFIASDKEHLRKELNKMRSWLRRCKDKGTISQYIFLRRKGLVARLEYDDSIKVVKPKETKKSLEERIKELGGERIQ